MSGPMVTGPPGGAGTSEADPAVSAVLLYRLATYWLPVAPGWVSLRLLQRWGYV